MYSSVLTSLYAAAIGCSSGLASAKPRMFWSGEWVISEDEGVELPRTEIVAVYCCRRAKVFRVGNPYTKSEHIPISFRI